LNYSAFSDLESDNLDLQQFSDKNNYREFKDYYQTYFGEVASDDFLANPELLSTNIKYAIRAGIHFWRINFVYEKADMGSTDDAVKKVTAKINPALDALLARQENFRNYWEAGYFKDFEIK
jgi:predicted chitinase